MKILGIETSCDETAICVLEANGDLVHMSFRILGDAVYSQVKTHEQYGGVFPMMAKREHAANLVPMLLKALEEAGLKKASGDNERNLKEIERLLLREPGLFEAVRENVVPIKRPDIDAIAVTHGPGLEPALWVGVNFAKALSALWDVPLIPVNHMEGHIVSVLLRENENSKFQIPNTEEISFPAIALLISGGHTQIVLARNWADYVIVGDTRDDAVGEAFDKVARMLGLTYPGGPQISRLAKSDRLEHTKSRFKLPRPMITSGDLDFSFSGLKTAVLYLVRKIPELTDDIKRAVAREFEDAAADVLTAKASDAIKRFGAKTLIVGGGVSGNAHIRARLAELASKVGGIDLRLPSTRLSTDNAVMIAMAGFVRLQTTAAINPYETEFAARGDLRLS